MHYPTHRKRAVHSILAIFHEQRFTQVFLHLQDRSSRKLWAALVIFSSTETAALFIFGPPLSRCCQQLLYRNQNLAQNRTSMVCCPLYLLFQGRFDWRNQLYLVLGNEQLLAFLINICAWISSVLQEDVKSVIGPHHLFWCFTWWQQQLQKCTCQLWEHILDCHYLLNLKQCQIQSL